MLKQLLHHCIGLLILTGLIASPLPAQTIYSDEKVDFSQFNLGGPRLGVTVAPNGDLRDELERQNMGDPQPVRLAFRIPGGAGRWRPGLCYSDGADGGGCGIR